MAKKTLYRLLAAFDAFDEWFRRSDFEGCSFNNTLLEIHEQTDPVHQGAVRNLDAVRSVLETEARQAGAANPAKTANQLQILMMGAIVSRGCGDRQAARDARELAEVLLGTIDARSAGRHRQTGGNAKTPPA